MNPHLTVRSNLLRIKWHVPFLWKIRNENQNIAIAQDLTYFYVFQKKMNKKEDLLIWTIQ